MPWPIRTLAVLGWLILAMGSAYAIFALLTHTRMIVPAYIAGSSAADSATSSIRVLLLPDEAWQGSVVMCKSNTQRCSILLTIPANQSVWLRRYKRSPLQKNQRGSSGKDFGEFRLRLSERTSLKPYPSGSTGFEGDPPQMGEPGLTRSF